MVLEFGWVYGGRRKRVSRFGICEVFLIRIFLYNFEGYLVRIEGFIIIIVKIGDLDVKRLRCLRRYAV